MKGIFQNLKSRFIFALAKRIPDCKNISPLLSDSLDRPLKTRERIVMRLHLWSCSACVNYLANLKFMRDVFHEQERQFDKDDIKVKLTAEARERLKNALKTPQS